MKQSIFKRFVIVITIALLLCGAISSIMISNIIKKQTEQDMLYALRLIDYNLDYSQPIQPQIDSLNPITMGNNTRITIIAPSGDVLGDTGVGDASTLPNHQQRSEVEQARKDGSGLARRYSETLNKTMLYTTILSSKSGYVIRLSIPEQGLLRYVEILLPAILVSIVIALVISSVLARKFAQSITEPLTEISQELLKIQDKGESLHFEQYQYDELNNIVVTTVKLSDRISKTMEKLRYERKKINYILDNMKEGLILLDEQQQVLTVNQSAKHFLNCTHQEPGKNIVHYTQNIDMIKAIDHAIKKDEISIFDILSYDQKIISAHITKIKKGIFTKHDSGVIILLIDVTSDRMAQQMRQEFFSNASHELKTPITSIQGFAELLENDVITDRETKREFLSRIKRETQNMTNLINDILMISRMETKINTETYTQINLSNTIREVAVSLQPLATQNEVRVTTDCPPSLVVMADPAQMHQLVNNLTVNAIKYNKPGGCVSVCAVSAPEGLVLTVSDTGIGIPIESQQRIFERFYRVDKGRSRKQGGTGLGLSIVKHIVQCYHGTISLESCPGKGTTITITIPFK